MTERKVLLLNASEEILNVIPWQEAATKFILGKARKPYGYDHEYKIKTCGGVFLLPSALVLVEYVKIPYSNATITKSNLLKRDEFECMYCGRSLTTSTMTVDHIFPECRGGKRKWKNVVAACKACNNRKDNKTPMECGMKLRRRPFVPSRVLMVLTAIPVTSKDRWKRWLSVA